MPASAVYTRYALKWDAAIVIAAYLSDPGLRDCFDSVHASLSAQADFRNHQPAFAKPRWPFGASPVPITFDCRWTAHANFVGSKPRWNYVVTHIASVALDLQFDEVEVRHEGATVVTTEANPPIGSRQRVGSVERLVLAPGRPAGRSRRPTVVLHSGLGLRTDAGLRVRFVRDGVVERQEPAFVGEDPMDEAPGTTAGREAGGDPNARRVVVRRRAGRPEAGDGSALGRTRNQALARTREAVELAQAANGWVVGDRTMASHPSGDEPLLLLEVTTPMGKVMVADAGSAEGDNCSLGILVPNGGQVTDAETSAIRRFAAEAGGHWRGQRLAGFRVKPASRPADVWSDPILYANFIAKAIRSALASK